MDGFIGLSQADLIDEHLTYIALVVGLIDGPQEIQPFCRLGTEVHSCLAGAGQRNGGLLYHLSGGIYQFQEIAGRLVLIELYEQAIGSWIGIGLVADRPRVRICSRNLARFSS